MKVNNMSRIRPCAVAGQFYPEDADILSHDLNKLLSDAPQAQQAQACPQALIVPHAGYVYSGACAAKAYAQLLPFSETIKKVLLLGPVHRVAINGLAATTADYWDCPLGSIPIDQVMIKTLRVKYPEIIEHDIAHAQEHSLEVHLPFLKKVINNFELIPFAVGHIDAKILADIIDLFWGDPSILIVISTDLSHFHIDTDARLIDQDTALAIEKYDWQHISSKQACGRFPMAGLLLNAKRHNAQITRIDLCNSSDTVGPKDRVVGYGAWTIFNEDE
jgi:AmmeMemoRadiSam system protein B